jgi:hypothetical protein
MDPPAPRKKQQAKEKAKSKGKIYSQKHIRMVTELRDKSAQNPDPPKKVP